jgi:hypothetical protein
MRRSELAGAILAAAAISMPVTYANAQDFHADLVGFNEAPLSIFSQGQGTLALSLDKKLTTQSLTFTLTFSGLSSDVTQAHIHLGEKHQAGGIFVFFCTNLGNGPAGTQACPAGGGTVTGMITAASILPIPAQGFPAGSFDALVTAITSTSEATYANVHTTNFPGGEIRGQIVEGKAKKTDK